MNKYKKILILIGLTLFCIPALLPLFHAGFFPIHDNAQVQRVYEMAKALHDGMFPVRWSLDLGYGYGYPLFTFYAPAIYYIVAVLYFLGVGAISASKTVVALGILFSAFGMFFLTKRLFSVPAAFIASVLYVYAPYHALDIYVRGDFAEAFAYSLLPFFIYALIRIYDQKKWRWVLLGACVYGILISTHNLTALMITPVAGIIAIILGRRLYIAKKWSQLYSLAAIFLLGILLSSFYWLPALAEMKYTNVYSITKGGSDYHVNFVCMSQLWDSPWGFGGSVPGCIDGMSFRVGKIHLLLAGFAVIGVVLLMMSKYLNDISGKRTVFIGLILGVCLSLFLTLSVSLPIWNSLSFMSYFQFPWRFLLLASFFISLLGGSSAYVIRNLRIPYKQIVLYIFVLGSIIVALVVNVKLFVPQRYTNATDMTFLSRKSLVWQTSKISDEYMPSFVAKPQTEPHALMYHTIMPTKPALVRLISQTTTELSATVDSTQSQDILLHIAPFPAWHIFVDTREVAYQNTTNGIRFLLTSGTHRIQARYIPTTVEFFANMLSVTGVILLFAGILRIRL